MSNDTARCPRCDDYDEVVEELKNEKELRERESKDALRKCEEGHKKKDSQIKGLEKKIVTITIVAAVAGTVVGKEFVDKIASYIESFNSVRDAASGLVSLGDTQTQPETSTPDSKDKSDEEEKEEDKDDKPEPQQPQLAYPGTPDFGWSSTNPFENTKLTSDTLDFEILYEDQPSLADVMTTDIMESLNNTLVDFQYDSFADSMDFSSNFFSLPDIGEPDFYVIDEEPSVIIPAPGSILLFAIAAPIIFVRKRRRK